MEIDLNSLMMRKIKENGGDKNDFEKLSSFISEYSTKSGAPEDSVTLIVIDSLSCGATKEDIETQLKAYQSKRSKDLIA